MSNYHERIRITRRRRGAERPHESTYTVSTRMLFLHEKRAKLEEHLQ